jgi:hypothetical protein
MEILNLLIGIIIGIVITYLFLKQSSLFMDINYIYN